MKLSKTIALLGSLTRKLNHPLAPVILGLVLGVMAAASPYPSNGDWSILLALSLALVVLRPMALAPLRSLQRVPRHPRIADHSVV